MRIGSLLSACLVLLLVSLAPGQARGARIGVLGAPEEPRFSEIVTGLAQGLRDLGFTEQSIDIIEGRVPRGDSAGERAVVERMLQQRIQLLFAIGSRLVTLARQVSADLPIVFITPGGSSGFRAGGEPRSAWRQRDRHDLRVPGAIGQTAGAVERGGAKSP